jgi:hypothetical protein
LAQSKWYFFAVYYYLHFQYNGVFFFAIVSLLVRLLQNNGGKIEVNLLRKAWLFFFWSCFPAFVLSTLWSAPGLILNVIGGAAAMAQGIGCWFLGLVMYKSFNGLKFRLQKSSRLLLSIAGISLVLKIVLQILSAFPSVANFAYTNRPFVIAYLHLFLIGVITFVLLAWYIENKLLSPYHWSIAFLIFSFISTEVIMVLTPIVDIIAVNSTTLLLLASVLLLLAFSIVVFVKKKTFAATAVEVKS